MNHKDKTNILIIDDKKDILTTCKSVLEDEGYKAYIASDDIEAKKILESNNINIVLLDVWLPGTDGLNMLSDIKKEYSDMPVIMMSGHAGLETAVRATKLGAYDFLEKPLSIDRLLSACDKALNSDTEIDIENNNSEESSKTSTLKATSKNKYLTKQKTIAKSVVVTGFALMEGRNTALTLIPSDVDTGIVFIDIVSNSQIKLSPESIFSKNNASVNSTVLANGINSIRTTEHFLAALNMYGITNLIIKYDGEVPNVDGSALVFCEALEEAGIDEQDEFTSPIVIDETLTYGNVHDDDTYMILSPFDGFEVTLRVDFPSPIGIQKHTFTYQTPTHFKDEIGKARSFNTIDNIDYAQKKGMAGSGLISSHIILLDGKVINTELYFEDEFVRHKILDIIGDMYILSRSIRGRINANKTSHAFNHNVVIDLAKRYIK